MTTYTNPNVKPLEPNPAKTDIAAALFLPVLALLVGGAMVALFTYWLHSNRELTMHVYEVNEDKQTYRVIVSDKGEKTDYYARCNPAVGCPMLGDVKPSDPTVQGYGTIISKQLVK